jgi:hypothetical protein
MNFYTIAQYFYKLYIAVLVIVLLPIFAFVVTYTFLPPLTQMHSSLYLLLLVTVIVVTDWFIVLVFLFKKIKSIRHHQGLRLKLEKYFRLTIVRYSFIAAGCFILALGLVLTKDDLFIALFAGNLLLAAWCWPTAARVCKDLALRGDEREMVYYKKDTLQG